jgi:hypothetical protein
MANKYSQFLSYRIDSLIQENKSDISQINIDANNREVEYLKELKLKLNNNLKENKKISSTEKAIQRALKGLGLIKEKAESINSELLKTKELLNLSEDEFKGLGLAFIQMTENSKENLDYDKIKSEIFKLFKGKTYSFCKDVLNDSLENLEIKSKVC